MVYLFVPRETRRTSEDISAQCTDVTFPVMIHFDVGHQSTVFIELLLAYIALKHVAGVQSNVPRQAELVSGGKFAVFARELPGCCHEGPFRLVTIKAP